TAAAARRIRSGYRALWNERCTSVTLGWHRDMSAADASSLGDASFERGAECLAHGLELDAVEHVLEEAAHDQPLGLRARKPARDQVEELIAVDAAERRPVGAADVVRHDLESGNRVRVRVGREQQVAVLLVRVRLLRVRLDADHAAPDRARRLPQRALER